VISFLQLFDHELFSFIFYHIHVTCPVNLIYDMIIQKMRGNEYEGGNPALFDFLQPPFSKLSFHHTMNE
jgi:hypothetical protein